MPQTRKMPWSWPQVGMNARWHGRLLIKSKVCFLAHVFPKVWKSLTLNLDLLKVWRWFFLLLYHGNSPFFTTIWVCFTFSKHRTRLLKTNMQTLDLYKSIYRKALWNQSQRNQGFWKGGDGFDLEMMFCFGPWHWIHYNHANLRRPPKK